MNSRTDETKRRLNEAWAAGRHHEACAVLLDEVMPRVCRWLLSDFSSISLDDAEDCFHDAVGGLMQRRPGGITNVYSYVFTSARNKALDIVNDRVNLVYYDPDSEAGEESDRSDRPQFRQSFSFCARPDMLELIAEAALDEELTIRGDQLSRLFSLTLTKVHWRRRRLTELLLTHGTGVSNDLLAELMGVSPGALKSLKSRTLSDLRRLLPIAADELGIDFQHVLAPPPEVLSPRPFSPSSDNGVNGE